MCYSAQIRTDYRSFVREFGAQLDIHEFVKLYWWRQRHPKTSIPKGMDLQFADPHGDDEREIKRAIDAYATQRATEIEQDLFKQRARIADAQRKLAVRPTKAAAESLRIATAKVERHLGWLADLRRTQLDPVRDLRIFPGHYAPVIIQRDGRRVVIPMRYQCRPAGRPAFFDAKYPGTYNARRDNLGGFWKEQFGHTHGVLVIDAFYENVDRHKVEGRALREGEAAQNMVLEFRPAPRQQMLVACLYSHWTGPGGEELWSFAAITDEPPPEVAAAGHDRCIIPLKPAHLDEWLAPDARHLERLQALLDDRERPYYEHRLAA